MRFLSFLSLTFLSLSLSGQGVLISNQPGQPSSDALLEVRSTTQGLLFPRLTTTQRNSIANPNSGLTIFNLTSQCLETYMPSGNWRQVGCDCASFPNPAFTFSPASGSVNSPVSCQPALSGQSYAWSFTGNPSFANNTNANSQQPQVIWSQAGSYQATLLITDANGCSDSLTQSISISNCVTGGSQTFSFTGTVQQWSIPAGVCSLTITARGAAGGDNPFSGCTYQATGGLGAEITGTFAVTPGTALSIIVGERGTNSNGNCANGAAGGGGGSFVYQTNTNQLWIAAGGGGGAALENQNAPPYVNGVPGQTTQNGSDGREGPGATPGGTAGNAGGGAGQSGGHGWNQVLSNPAGRQPSGGYNAPGGYGGGGANHTNGGGGGGGYSGGGGTTGCCNATFYSAGGGGGSFNAGLNQNNQSGTQSGNGQVVITW